MTGGNAPDGRNDFVKEVQLEKPGEEKAAMGSRRNAEAGFMQRKSQGIPGKQKRSLDCRYRTLFERTCPERDLVCTRDMEELICKAASRQLAAIIAEPMDGEVGFIAPLKEYQAIVAKIIRKYGDVWIGDEVRTGLGRAGGTWFGLDPWGVQPNMITIAKGLAVALPAGDTGATPELADSLEELQKRHLRLGEVRGMGLVQGVELVRDRKTHQPTV
jgi:4-aminobutyrate aminotransferase-like enzyme